MAGADGLSFSSCVPLVIDSDEGAELILSSSAVFLASSGFADGIADESTMLALPPSWMQDAMMYEWVIFIAVLTII